MGWGCFSEGSGWSRVYIVQEFSVLSDFPFLGFLARKSRLLGAAFFCLCPLAFPGCLLLSSGSGTVRQKDTQGLHLRMVPPMSPARRLSSLYLPMFPCFISNARVFSCTLHSNRKKHTNLIFLQVEVPQTSLTLHRPADSSSGRAHPVTSAQRTLLAARQAPSWEGLVLMHVLSKLGWLQVGMGW